MPCASLRRETSCPKSEGNILLTLIYTILSGICDENYDFVNFRGGIYTPGAAFGDTKIIERLKETGQFKFTFEQEEENPSSEKFKTN